MSRGLDRTDEREQEAPSSSSGVVRDSRPTTGSLMRSRERDQDQRDQEVELPEGRARDLVVHRDSVYHMRGSESRLLEVLATFRVVLERDLAAGLYRRCPGRLADDVRSLREQGLILRRALVATRKGGTQGV